MAYVTYRRTYNRAYIDAITHAHREIDSDTTRLNVKRKAIRAHPFLDELGAGAGEDINVAVGKSNG